ncbi:MAG TPA: hypothetical protein VG796_07330 [Verrucomicrobiales bacterium]|jgi:hypothetical protein|nr:hypothetical protein [Verrucomicrobiales bacterium]
MKPTFHRRSRFRGFAFLGILIHLAGTGAGLTAGYVALRGHFEWSGAQSDLKEAGYSLDPFQFQPPDVAAEGNFGATPVLKDILMRLENRTPEVAARIARLQKLNVTSIPERVDPKSSPLELLPGTPADWQLWRVWLRKKPGFKMPAAEEEKDDARAVYAALRSVDEPFVLELIEAAKARRAAQFTPGFRARVEEAIKAGETMIDPATQVKLPVTAYRFLSVRAEAALACGDADGFSRLLPVLLTMQEMFGEEKTVLGFLVSSSMRRDLCELVRRNIAEHRLTADALRAIQEYLSAVDVDREWVEARFSELIWFNRMVNTVMLKGEGSPMRMMPKGSGGLLLIGMVDGSKAAAVRSFLDEAKLVKTADWPTRLAEDKRRRDGPEPNMLERWRTMLADGYAAYSSLRPGMLLNEMKRRLCIVACALERHRLAGGKPPEKLSDLPPALLPAVPLDVDGQPLRYRLVDGEQVFWSIGRNLKDDWQGSRPADELPKEEIDFPDWQWRLPK